MNCFTRLHDLFWEETNWIVKHLFDCNDLQKHHFIKITNNGTKYVKYSLTCEADNSKTNKRSFNQSNEVCLLIYNGHLLSFESIFIQLKLG